MREMRQCEICYRTVHDNNLHFDKEDRIWYCRNATECYEVVFANHTCSGMAESSSGRGDSNHRVTLKYGLPLQQSSSGRRVRHKKTEY